jgi:uncharacterized SAM-binding protein YcdF (DUF218 family)
MDHSQVPPTPPIIVVLGAPNDETGQLLPTARERALAALRVYRAEPSSRLLLTGGQGAHFNTAPRPHHEYVARFLAAEGVPAAAIMAGVPSSNTVEDARLSAERLANEPVPLVLKLVTSDFHLARARLLFEQAFPAARIELHAAPAGLPPGELARALEHEARAIARLFAAPAPAPG